MRSSYSVLTFADPISPGTIAAFEGSIVVDFVEAGAGDCWRHVALCLLVLLYLQVFDLICNVNDFLSSLHLDMLATD